MVKILEKLTNIFGLIILVLIILTNVIKSREIKTPNTIYNVTENKELTKYLAVALNAYDIKGITIIIRYFSLEEQALLITPTEFTSATTQYKDGLYCISLIPTTPETAIRIIGHEIVHVKQLYDKRIIYSDSSFIWKGKELINEIPQYEKRPWEIEAMNKEDSIAKIINDEIY